MQEARVSDFSTISRNAAVLLSLALLVGCATSSTGRRQLILMDDATLEAQSAALYGEMRQQMKVSTNEAQRNFVLCVSNAVTQSLQTDTPRYWEVTLFEDPNANAFALPGAKIGVYTGLLAVTENADQLGAVIGHEIAHVLERHANERASSNAIAGTAVAIGTEILAGGQAPANKQATQQILGQGAQILGLLPYGRAHESEADQIGVVLMAAAGFNPAESVKLWENMAAANSTQPLEILSTHPAPATRIAKLTAHLSTAMPIYQQAIKNGRRPSCRKA